MRSYQVDFKITWLNLASSRPREGRDPPENPFRSLPPIIYFRLAKLLPRSASLPQVLCPRPFVFTMFLSTFFFFFPLCKGVRAALSLLLFDTFLSFSFYSLPIQYIADYANIDYSVPIALIYLSKYWNYA